VPATAARLADVIARHHHSPEVGRRGEHLPQQLAVARLQLGALAQGYAGLGNPVGERVAHPLQLAKIENARLDRDRLDPVPDLGVAESLAEEPGKLALEPADLASQLRPREALVDLDAEPVELVSLQQSGHRPEV
jgi:hypothetical protein